MNPIKIVSVWLILLFLPGVTFPFGEVFKLKGVSLTDFCTALPSAPSYGTGVWLRIDDQTRLTVSKTADFTPGTTEELTIQKLHLITPRKAAFLAAKLSDAGIYPVLTLLGTVKFKPPATIKSMSGQVIFREMQNGEDCIAAGDFYGRLVSLP
jgi:hypothetical protein